MTVLPDAVLIDNAGFADTRPHLSVLTPFFRDDPRPLLAALEREAGEVAGDVELVLLDDAGGDAALSAAAAEAAQASALPARLVRLRANAGRARGRNRLVAEARGRHLLFLDSDMLPDRADFLGAYLELIAAEDPAVAVGGFSLAQTPLRREHALHRALSLRAECIPAAQRAKMPDKYVWTSNLLVRRDVFEAERFDEGFCGWGWEDTEWGVRVSARFGVTHIDNPATHLGLDTAEALLAKYEQSPANFARMAKAHPAAVARFPSHRTARWLKRTPARRRLLPALKRLALSARAPLALRIAAAKLYRAGLYAAVV